MKMRGFLRPALILPVALFLGGCVHTNNKTTTLGSITPPSDATILFMEPDVELALLTTGGANEPRADWTDSAKINLTTDIEAELRTRGTKVIEFNTKTEPSPHVMQLVHLHEAVGSTILGNVGIQKLPNKEKVFDWSLGPGVKEIADTYHADYALFLFARGTYASTGRVTVAILAALAHVAIPMGQQQVFASLVDLHSGDVVWIGTAATGESDDMSGAGGAASVAKSLLETIPLGTKKKA